MARALLLSPPCDQDVDRDDGEGHRHPVLERHAKELEACHHEANLTGALAHDLDRDQGGLGDLLARITAVGEDPMDEREDAARSLQKRSAAVAIPDPGRMGLDDEAAPVGVNQRVALAPVDLLARIVTARATGLGGLDALAVNNRGRRAGVAPDPFTDLEIQLVPRTRGERPINLIPQIVEAAFTIRAAVKSVTEAGRRDLGREARGRAVIEQFRSWGGDVEQLFEFYRDEFDAPGDFGFTIP
jgi:hypothetical protein